MYIQVIIYYCPQTTPLGHIPIKPMVVIPTHEAFELDILKFLNLFCETESETCCLLQKHRLRKLAMLILDVLPCSLVENHQVSKITAGSSSEQFCTRQLAIASTNPASYVFLMQQVSVSEIMDIQKKEKN